MSDSNEKVSYLHPRTPSNGPRNRARIIPFKLSEFGSVKKEKRNVYLRIKPKAKNQDAVSFVALDDSTLVPVNREGQKGKKFSHKFKFTKIFGPKCNQEDIFKEACFSPLSNFLLGGNCFVFAYGATNAGKTFTIQGSQSKPGIIPRAINLLFNSITGQVSNDIKFKPDKLNNVLWLNKEDVDQEYQRKQSILSYQWDKTNNKAARSVSTLSLFSNGSQSSNSTNVSDLSDICSVFQAMKENLDDAKIELDGDSGAVYSIWVSYAEIYNENIYDLLQQNPTKSGKPLSLGENEQKEVFIKGLTEICVFSGEEAFKVFLFGKHKLHQASTNVNHVSSRSHSIFSIKLIKHLNVDCPTFAQLSMCSFVDLAGAERAKKTLNAGERMKESQCINTSLHILGKCLETMRHNQKSKESCTRLLPCRESKLTRLFQRALEGKEALTMIVNINQDEKLFDETMTVLRFSAVAMELEYDTKDKNSTICSLRKSRFSQFMETFSASFQQSSMESISECPEDARYMKLLAFVEELQRKLEEEKKKNLTIAINVRKEAFAHCKTIMANMENNFRKRLQEEKEVNAEYEDIRTQMYEKYIERHCKRKLSSDSESSDEDEESEDEENTDVKKDYIEKIQFLQNKVEALTALVESSEKIKTDYASLNAKYSKLQFEFSSKQKELENAVKLSEAINSGPDSTDNVMKELQNQLSEHQQALKEKNEELEKMKTLLNEAKLEFDAHLHEHEDFAERNSELEKMIADRDEKIDDLKDQLNICNKKLFQQQQIVNSRESEEFDMKNKMQSFCEARDEFKFKCVQLESEVRKLQKENSELKSRPKSLPNDNDIKALEALVASHADQIQKYAEKLKDQENINKQLQEEMAAEKTTSACDCQDTYEQEICILQKEIKELAKAKQTLLDQIDIQKKETNQQNEALKICEAALEQEQANTKEIRKIFEAEKENLVAEVRELREAMNMLQIANETLVKDKNEVKLQIMDLEESLKLKEEQMDAFKARRDAQFKSYESMLKHERQLRETDQREVHQLQTAIRTLTPTRPDHTAEVNRLKDKLQEAYMQISELQKSVKKNYPPKIKSGRAKKTQNENTPLPSDDEIEIIPALQGFLFLPHWTQLPLGTSQPLNLTQIMLVPCVLEERKYFTQMRIQRKNWILWYLKHLGGDLCRCIQLAVTMLFQHFILLQPLYIT